VTVRKVSLSGQFANAKQIIGPAGGVNGPRPAAARDDFELRHEHIALLEQLKRLPDGTRVRDRRGTRGYVGR